MGRVILITENDAPITLLNYIKQGNPFMYAERLMLETDAVGHVKQLPNLPPNKHIEAIFLVVDDITPPPALRQPHPDIAGKMKICGDVINTLPETAWDLPK